MNLPLSPYRRLLPYIRPHLAWLVVGSLLALVVAAMDGAVAWLVKPAMDEIFIKRDLLMLKLIPLALVAVYIIKATARYLQAYLMASVGERV
ncbi:MAG: ABC transporter permease, partial [Candidatus Rokuibacteriota bacterium]